MPAKIRKILLVRTDRLGDLLMNLPVIHRLKQNHPNAVLTLVCDAAWAPLFHHHLDVNRVIGVSGGGLSDPKFRRALMADLKKNRFDCAVMTAPSKGWHWAAFRLGIPVRIGFRRKWGFLLTHAAKDQKAVSGRHEIDSNLEAVNPICAKPWNRRMALGLDMHPRKDEFLARFGLTPGKKRIVFHLTSTNPAKEVPPTLFGGVISKLLERPRHQVIVVGSNAGPHTSMLKAFEGEPRFVNLVGRTNITELALVLAEAHCVVSTDSGPFHLAWIQGIPTVALFVLGAEGSTPARWGVYPNFAPSRTIQATVREFEPSTVLAAIQECALDPMGAAENRAA